MKADLEASLRKSDNQTKLWEFEIPQLRVGNIDSLIFLSDALKRTATTVEGTIRKVAAFHMELDEQDKDKLEKKSNQTISVKGAQPEETLTRFKWDDARYPRRKSLPELTQTVKGTITTAEKDLRERSLEYSVITSKISQLQANESGNLMTRDINSVIKEYNAKLTVEQQPFKPIEARIAQDTKGLIDEYNSGAPQNMQYSPYLTTLYVIVPKNEQKNWLKVYESLLPASDGRFVVPSSAVKLAEDNDSILNSVIVFTKDIEEFKNACRVKRYNVRKNDNAVVINEEEKQALKSQQKKLKVNLSRWTETTFADVFNAWLHLKCIQCFVESILRYGLPPDFVSILILPKKGSEKKLIKQLCKEYEHLGGGFNDREDDAVNVAEDKQSGANERYFPFVHLEINLSLAS